MWAPISIWPPPISLVRRTSKLLVLTVLWWQFSSPQTWSSWTAWITFSCCPSGRWPWTLPPCRRIWPATTSTESYSRRRPWETSGSVSFAPVEMGFSEFGQIAPWSNRYPLLLCAHFGMRYEYKVYVSGFQRVDRDPVSPTFIRTRSPRNT